MAELPSNVFGPTVRDVVSVNDIHWVILLHENKDSRFISPPSRRHSSSGFLLHDHYGYLYEKTHRAYSFDEPVHFNLDEHYFEFYQLTYGYERIPSLEDPTRDPIHHQSSIAWAPTKQVKLKAFGIRRQQAVSTRTSRFCALRIGLPGIQLGVSEAGIGRPKFGKKPLSRMATWIHTTPSTFTWSLRLSGTTASSSPTG